MGRQIKLAIICALGAFALIAGIFSLARAQTIPGVAQSAPNAWTFPGIVGRTVATGGDAPDLVMPSVGGAVEALTQYSGTNGSGSARYVQVFRSNTVPANGTSPILEDSVAANSSFCHTLWPIQSLTATGFVIACSTTQGFLTITSTNDCFISATVSP